MKDISMKQKYAWNTMGGLTSSLMSIVLLLIVNRSIGSEYGGIFAFAYSHSQLMYTIGVFEVRPLQCTDIKEHYKFNTYFTLRLLSCLVMMVISIAYIVANGYSGEKAQIILLLCIYKATEAFVDLYSAAFQQFDRIEYSGKTCTLRSVGVMVLFTIIILCTHNVIYASISMIVFSVFSFIVYDYQVWKKIKNIKAKLTCSGIKELIIDVIPLFFSTFIMMYINNAPKYAIDNYCSNDIQNEYNILFMPAFVINMFSVFVFRPMLTDMTEKWNNRNISAFNKSIRKVVYIILLLTVVCIIGGCTIGIVILSWMYNIDLSGRRLEFFLVMIYGGMNALIVFLYYAITVTRNQKYLILSYIVGFLIAFFMSPVLVKSYEMLGAVVSAILSLGVADLLLCVILILVVKKRGNIKEND